MIMRKLILGVFALALFASCETDVNESIDTTTNVDLRVLTPKAEFDNQSSGMYAGVIVADNNNFHGKLWININNNGKFSAMVETIQKDIHYFQLASETNGIYSYEGDIGSFDFSPSNITKTEFTNIIINNTSGVASVLKEKNQVRMTPILGTYSAVFAGDESGTWNFIAPDQEGASFNLIDQAIITTSTGLMITEDATTFETGLPGCYDFGGPVPPLFANYPNTDDIEDNPLTPDVDESALRDFAVFAINQTLPTNIPNKTIVYDLGLSQDNADFNDAGTYNLMTAFPEATRASIFGAPDLAAGCYNIAGDAANGYFAYVDDTGAFVEGGTIILDTAGLVLPPPPPTAPGANDISNGKINQAQELVANPQF